MLIAKSMGLNENNTVIYESEGWDYYQHPAILSLNLALMKHTMHPLLLLPRIGNSVTAGIVLN